MRLGKRAQWNFAALGFAIPCLGMLMVMLISHYAPFGKYSMLYSDMYHQYYPFFVAFRNAIRGGNGLLYTWSVGMGMDYLGLIAYYLASPLNLVSVLLPESWLLGYFSLLVPIKLGLAGLFFSLFLKDIFRRNDVSIAVFGGLYGLCAWALGYQWNVMWLDTFALLPLVVLGEVKLLRDKKVVLYTVSLFLSVFTNYYIGLFTCFFVFFLFFIYEICRWGGIKKFFCDLLRIGLFSAIALGLTAILTVPALFALGTTQSSVNKFPTSFRLNIAKENTILGLLDAMRQVAGNMGGSLEPSFKEGLPNLYCGIISVFLMFAYLLSKQVKLRDKVCAVFLLVFFNLSFIVRQLDYIWHGFHFTNMIPYRFSFLYSFVVLYMAYRAWTLRGSFSTRRILAAGVLAAGVLACSNQLTETIELTLFGRDWDFPLYFVYNLVFLVLYLLAMLSGNVTEPIPEEAEREEAARIRLENIRQRRRSRALVLSVAWVELIANLICFGLYFPGTGVSDYPRGKEKTASVIRYMKEREEDTLFYRAETTHSQTLNDGALNGYNGVSAFTSSANVKTTLFMQALGYGAKNTYNRYLFEESSPVANLFLNLKYMIERDGKDRESAYFTEVNRFGNTALLENTAYLPLGFLTESALGELAFTTSGNAFSFQNDLFSAATGVTGDVWHKLEGENLSILPGDAWISEENDTGYCRYETTDQSEVIYSFTADRDGFACIHLDLPKRNDFYVSVNGLELYKEKISLPQMLAVSDVQVGDVIDVRIVCPAGESSTMTVGAAILNPERFQAGYEILNASTLKLTKFRSTRVEGTIDCDRDGLLYTSIPQNGNWQATVDGRPVETAMVGDCMLALPLSAGSHSITLTYRNSAFILGARITLACAAVFAALLLTAYADELRPRQGKFSRGREKREK